MHSLGGERDRVHRRKYWSREEAAADIADYIEGFSYNRRRRRSPLGASEPTGVRILC